MNNKNTRMSYFNHVTGDDEFDTLSIKRNMDYLYSNFSESDFLKMLDFVKKFINFSHLERKLLLDVVSSLEYKFSSNDFYKFVHKFKLNESELVNDLKAVGAKEEFSIEGLELGDDIRAFTFNKGE